ncbi:MmcQ/YjbR family DNA-binding protein [Rhodococcus aerolatus]
MGHPVTFSDDDPHLADVRRLALALPEAVEKVAWGRPTFRAGASGKMFAVYERGPVLVVKPEPAEREALLADPRFTSPAYWGASGWVGLTLAAPDLDEVAELLDASYRQVALKRLVRVLDAG